MGHIDFKIGNGIQSVYSNGDSGRLAVDLQDARSNIILVFHVRFEESVVVLNSSVNSIMALKTKKKNLLATTLNY